MCFPLRHKGEGFTLASYVLNHQVEANPSVTGDQSKTFTDPAHFLRKVAFRLGIRARTVGLMTAVPMTQLVTGTSCFGWALGGVFCDGRCDECRPGGRMATATFSSRQTGQARHDQSHSHHERESLPCCDGRCRASGHRGQDRRLARSCGAEWHGGMAATGTGTDAVVIACQLQGQGPAHIYSGTHTVIGALVGRAVTNCMTRGLAKAKAWRESHQ